MSSPGTGVVRLARTGVLAAVMVALSLASHLVAGGHPPEAWSLFPAAAIGVGTAYIATRRRTGFGTIFALLSIAQFGFHSLAEWCPPWCVSDAHEMMEHADGSSMTAAHLVAALVSAGIVAYGDRILWMLWQWLTRHLTFTPIPPQVVATSFNPFVLDRSVPPTRPATGALSRRGPPLISAFV